MSMNTAATNDEITFDEYHQEWVSEFIETEASSFEKGRRFAYKLVSQWLGVSDDDDDLELCDGSGDGGIDIAYLRRSEVDISDTENASDQNGHGDVWYLIQSKYGSSFVGQDTVISEGRKAIRTIAGENDRVSENTRRVLAKLDEFRANASDQDRIILVFATEKPISSVDRTAMDDLRTMGRERIGSMFDVEDVSVATIWENRDTTDPARISLKMTGKFVDPSAGLRVGTIPLMNLYEFLKEYRGMTGNLDQLYEKNVRQFLGGRRKINKGIKQTLDEEPEMFGLYNNGITIVVSDFRVEGNGDTCVLYDPYVVNGCQTTKTIWGVLDVKLNSGGTGDGEKLRNWNAGAERGVVVVKIVKSDSVKIVDITRYTNSQNAIREQDFLALRADFVEWSSVMADKYGVFLEIQRGGWDSRRAYQKQHPTERQFKHSANAFDLIKIYGAGWLKEPGHAAGRSGPFLPGGTVFKRITGPETINVDDLYAAYKLQQLANAYEFGRGANVKDSRRLTRFFYYFVVIELLEDALRRSDLAFGRSDVTEALLRLADDSNGDAGDALLDAAIEVVDEYLDVDADDCVFKEQLFIGNPSVWFKNDRIGKNGEETYHLNSLLAAHKNYFRRGIRGQDSPYSMVIRAVTS